jgi:hypothetical protein
VRRDQLEHVIRASGGILGEDALIVIGSQAILASIWEGLPEVVTRSIEVDILPLDDPDESKATLVEGSSGEGSLFQESFGVYAQGVGQRTARLPTGWRQRLIPLGNENTRGVTALCLEPHDLCVAKLLAARPKEIAYVRALLDAGIVRGDVIRARLGETEATDEERRQAAAALTP